MLGFFVAVIGGSTIVIALCLFMIWNILYDIWRSLEGISARMSHTKEPRSSVVGVESPDTRVTRSKL